MKMFRFAVPVLLTSLLLPMHVNAQGMLPISIEARAGAAIPTGDLADYLDTGFGLELNGTLYFTPQIGAYAGYSLAQVDYSDFDLDGTDSGFSLGILASAPVPSLAPWVRAGAILHQFEVSEGSASRTSDRGIGFEIGGGFAFPVAPMLSITPGVRYRSYEAEVDLTDLGEGTWQQDVNYLTVDIGARLTL